MTENGIIAHGLRANWCDECGQAKSFRLWPGVLTGCKTCDEVVTRHHCDDSGRPDSGSLDVGASWECPDCGTVWNVTEVAAFCDECGCSECETEKRWAVSVRGDRIDTAPRHVPQLFTPFRNLFRPALAAVETPPPPGPFGECYQMIGGSWVHVRPGCRCKQ